MQEHNLLATAPTFKTLNFRFRKFSINFVLKIKTIEVYERLSELKLILSDNSLDCFELNSMLDAIVNSFYFVLAKYLHFFSSIVFNGKVFFLCS